MNQEEELASLRAQVTALREKAASRLRLSMSEKGGIMVLGLRSFPVTFYADEWTALFGQRDAITAFAAENAPELTRRNDAARAAKKAA